MSLKLYFPNLNMKYGIGLKDASEFLRSECWVQRRMWHAAGRHSCEASRLCSVHRRGAFEEGLSNDELIHEDPTIVGCPAISATCAGYGSRDLRGGLR